MSIVSRERETYEHAWAINAYGEKSPGVIYFPLFMDMIAKLSEPKSLATLTALDAGCGAGAGAIELTKAGFKVQMCDITDAGLDGDSLGIPFSKVVLWEPLTPQLPWVLGSKYDFVYCCDVLEHVPTPFTMLVISRLLEVTRRAMFLTISLMPDQFGAWVGKPLHQTVQTFHEWQDQLNALGTVLEARDLFHCGVYLVEPK